MLVYRVFPYLASARAGAPGHPLYEHTPQRGGRADHPDYYVWYLSQQAEAACGESFGNHSTWDDSMLKFPLIPAHAGHWERSRCQTRCASSTWTTLTRWSVSACDRRKSFAAISQ